MNTELTATPFLASALSAVIGPEALPLFLSTLGTHIQREVALKESQLSEVWDTAERHEKICRGNFDHRIIEYAAESKMPNKPALTIFSKSNQSLNYVRATVRYETAKTFDEIFGTEPWTSFKPQQTDDQNAAESVSRWGKWKLDQKEAAFESAARRLIRASFGNGIAVAKVQKVRLCRKHAEFAQVLVDDQDMPVMGNNGKPVTMDDEAPVPTPAPLPQAPDLAPVPPMPSEEMVTWTSKPEMSLPRSAVRYVPQVLPVEVVSYDGPTVKLLFYRNFLCDNSIPNLDDQPFLGDTYEIRVGELRRLYDEGLLPEDTFNQVIGAATTESKDPAAKPREDEPQGLRHWATLPINEFVRVADVELDYEVPWQSPAQSSQAGETGEMPEPIGPTSQMAKLWAVVAVETGQVIWADFLGNITPEGQSHYEIVTADSDETRLFGISIPHKYEDVGNFLDATYNQVIYRNDFAANPACAYDPNDFKQTCPPNTKKLVWKPGMTLEKTATAADKPLNELIETFTLPQMETISQWLVDLSMRMMQTDSGVSGAAQGDVGSLPQINTATGVRSILGFGSVLHKLAIREVKSGIERVLRKFFDFALYRPAGDEFYTYFDKDTQRQAVMDAATKRRLKLDVSLTLSRFAESEEIETAARAMTVAKDYLTLPPQVQMVFRKLYVRMLSMMGMNDAESLLPDPSVMAPPMPGAVDPTTGAPMMAPGAELSMPPATSGPATPLFPEVAA